jgi:hypothetical protein
MEATWEEIRLAGERFAIERLRQRHLASLLIRTDRMLAGLEGLNLLDVKLVAGSWRLQLAALIADLPFEYQPAIGPRPSPTEALDVVFDIQAVLLQSITGSEAKEGDGHMEAAS